MFINIANYEYFVIPKYCAIVEIIPRNKFPFTVNYSAVNSIKKKQEVKKKHPFKCTFRNFELIWFTYFLFYVCLLK